MADEPVVVLKLRPVKAGNRLEHKTGVTTVWYLWGMCRQKWQMLRRGEAFFKNVQSAGMTLWMHKLLDEAGYLQPVGSGTTMLSDRTV
ncbi:hypothetical protein [Endozoicomonas sp. SCSIO W0465]|uniref:hypothetical protein n=1 Tax=Endozoicomonas sp. SCSIO W0465 TaxID=2918516 RepID=UPI002075E7D1|nr:hypothetical protein [Endozoicomonas sp. SCSIO W0465]USE38588.1 hypothetical protein MJO57_10685 [Endozoicomonas sp. SCSIO W0465]